MSASASDTYLEFYQFVSAYGADYVTREGKLVIDDPKIRQRLVKAIDSYTAIYRKGCTPPDSVAWDDFDNNKAFLTQAVVMVANPTLSIPNALKPNGPRTTTRKRDDRMAARVATASHFRSMARLYAAVVFKAGGHTATAKEFVRFLVGEGWLMHYLDFSGERLLPTISELLDQPFWLDPSDPHRMAAACRSARDRRFTTTPQPRATGGTSWSTRRSSGRRRSTALPRRA